MHSWVFRHRLRLRVIYGPLPGAEEDVRTDARPPVDAQPPTKGLEGTIERRSRYVVLRPMRRRGR